MSLVSHHESISDRCTMYRVHSSLTDHRDIGILRLSAGTALVRSPAAQPFPQHSTIRDHHQQWSDTVNQDHPQPGPVISETVVNSVRLRYQQYLETRGKKYFWNSICVGWGRTVPFLSWCHYTDTTQFLVLHDAYFHWSVYMVLTQNSTFHWVSHVIFEFQFCLNTTICQF